jgi:hypothetical protein
MTPSEGSTSSISCNMICLCRHVADDRETGLFSLHDICDGFSNATFPVRLNNWHVFVRLVDAQDASILKIEGVDLPTSAVVYTGTPLNLKDHVDEKGVARIGICLKEMYFAEPTTQEIRAYADDVLIAKLKFYVEESPYATWR